MSKAQKPSIFTVSEAENGLRLDKFMTLKMPDFSRSRIQAMIKEGAVTSSAKPENDCSSKVKSNQEYAIIIPEAKESELQEADIPLNIVYEDKDLLVVDKQAGLTVHPGAGNYQDTLANALLFHCGKSLSGIGGVMRPGIVHRLDKDTSGLMVVAKNDKAHRSLAKQIKTRELKRVYKAIVWGVPSPSVGKISTNIGRSPKDRKKMAVMRSGGREAVTHYKVLEVFPNNLASLVECKLETGRTHQIRVHMAHKGYPVIGDRTYGGSRNYPLTSLPQKSQEFIKKFPRQALHSYYIAFEHPRTGKFLEFTSNFRNTLPEDINELVKKLKNLKSR